MHRDAMQLQRHQGISIHDCDVLNLILVRMHAMLASMYRARTHARMHILCKIIIIIIFYGIYDDYDYDS